MCFALSRFVRTPPPATLPLNSPRPTDGIVLWLRGPRRTLQEHRDYLAFTVEEAAGQLSGQVAGVIAIEDVRDTEVYAANPVFTLVRRMRAVWDL